MLQPGCGIDKEAGLVRGFWDMLEKKSILLTASTCFDMEDLLLSVYKVCITDYVVIKDADHGKKDLPGEP